MRRVLIAAAALMLSAVPSFAGDEIMANYFGNTVISKSSMGEGHAHYKADHTFDISMTAMGMSHGYTGAGTDEAALRALGDEGVLAMVCDSTNVFVDGRAGSEAGSRSRLAGS